MQTLHNALYRAPIEKCSIQIHGGGTYGMAAPGTCYLQNVTYALFKRLGYSVELNVIRHGFYPKGGAEAVATHCAESLGVPRSRPGRAGRAGIDRGMYRRRAKSPASSRRRTDQRKLNRLNVSKSLLRGVVMDIGVEYSPAPSVGVGVDVWCRFSSGAILGIGTVLGERGVPSETIGKRAGKKLRQLLESDATVDEYASDQLVPLLCLAEGPSKFKLDAISSHLQTNLEIIRNFFPREYRITPSGNGFIFEYL